MNTALNCQGGLGSPNIISRYTRAQAIADGYLVDLSKLYPNDTRIFRCNVACTATVWKKLKNQDDNHGNPAVWDLCWMSVHRKVKELSKYEHLFECSIPFEAEPDIFKAHIGGGDYGEAVITIMMPQED